MNVRVELRVLVDGDGANIFRPLYVWMDFPAIVPVGSVLYMPTPVSWSDQCMQILAKIVQYSVVGNVIECAVDVCGTRMDESDYDELLAIGYASEDDCDAIVEAAMNSLAKKST